MEALSTREKQIIDYMKKFVREKGYPPTVREMCKDLGISSTSTVFKDINNLEKKGYLRKDPSRSRSLEILDWGEDGDDRHYSAGTSDAEALLARERENVLEVPVVGRIAAGTPILSEQNIEDTFPVPVRYVNTGKKHFMLTVHGESMIEAGIFDGDLILVEEQHDAANGEIVVAMIQGEFEAESTVKTFYKENGHIRLQPQNSSMNPIIVPTCEVLGVVKGVFRYFS